MALATIISHKKLTFDVNDISVYSEDNHDKDNEREQQEQEFVLHFFDCQLILRKLEKVFDHNV